MRCFVGKTSRPCFSPVILLLRYQMALVDESGWLEIGMDVCPWSFYVVCACACVGTGLATSRSLVHWVLPYVVKSDYETELTEARAY
jgi:hypothetical protein